MVALLIISLLILLNALFVGFLLDSSATEVFELQQRWEAEPPGAARRIREPNTTTIIIWIG